MDDLLTASDAVRVIDQISPNRPISAQTLRYHERRGALPAIRTFGRGMRLYKRADVEAFARARADVDSLEGCEDLD